MESSLFDNAFLLYRDKSFSLIVCLAGYRPTSDGLICALAGAVLFTAITA